jgi:hypothetical protein
MILHVLGDSGLDPETHTSTCSKRQMMLPTGDHPQRAGPALRHHLQETSFSAASGFLFRSQFFQGCSPPYSWWPDAAVLAATGRPGTAR